MNLSKIDVTKITLEKIQKLLDNDMPDEAKELRRLYDEHQATILFKSISNVDRWLDRFITVHPAMIKLKAEVRLLSSIPDPVLILGETGTGKEILANALHGDRAGRFIPINCAGIPDNLLESILFGHMKGAFTGAVSDKIGLFKAAGNGTIFLDEIGDMSLPLQAKLLRAIQEKRILAVGSDKEEEITCRIVAATCKDIKPGPDNHSFRVDLYWRLSTFILQTLPLRERTCDITPILEELDHECRIKDFDHWFLTNVSSKDIAGNVRELQQMVRRFYVLGGNV